MFYSFTFIISPHFQIFFKRFYFYFYFHPNYYYLLLLCSCFYSVLFFFSFYFIPVERLLSFSLYLLESKKMIPSNLFFVGFVTTELFSYFVLFYSFFFPFFSFLLQSFKRFLQSLLQ